MALVAGGACSHSSGNNRPDGTDGYVADTSAAYAEPGLTL